jgi:hypothetical protein
MVIRQPCHPPLFPYDMFALATRGRSGTPREQNLCHGYTTPEKTGGAAWQMTLPITHGHMNHAGGYAMGTRGCQVGATPYNQSGFEKTYEDGEWGRTVKTGEKPCI